MSAALEVLPIVTDEGLVYDVDPETGEVLAVHPPEPEFVIDSRERADWVLGKMLHLDAEIAAIDTAAIVQQARAILENAEAKKKDLARRRAALEWRFGPELAQFAKANLGKTKTWKGYYGSVSFRATPAKLKVSDPVKAAWWALEACPGAARVEFDLGGIPPMTQKLIAETAMDQEDAVKATFFVSQLPPDTRERVMKFDAECLAEAGPEVVPEGESVKISTGVK